MKSKFTYMGLLAILMSACTTGSYVTSSYTDDIYFNPGDVPPPIVAETITKDNTVPQKPEKKVIVSEITKNEDGTNTTNNYVFEGAVVDDYSTEKDSNGSDTITYYEDGELQQVINNYYDNDGNVDYAYRIQQFHNPYFYDPFFYDSWYYDPYYYNPGWSFGFSWGWGYPYYGYGYPYYPYYGWGYYPPYYGGYPPYYGGYPPIYVDSDSYQYGQRRSAGTNVSRNDGRGSSGSVAQNSSGRNKSADTGVSGLSNSGNTGRSATSSSGRRDASGVNDSRTKSGTPNSNVLTEKRRSGGEGMYSRQTGVESNAGNNTKSSIDRSINSNSTRSQTQSYSRPGSTAQSRSYTRPSSSSSSVNMQPRVVNKSAVGSNSTGGYSQPKTTSSYNQAYRSSSTYSRSSSTGISSRSYSSPASSSNSYRSSTPASSGSYSSGSSSSGRSSGASFSGSSGGGGGSYSGGGSSGGGGGSRSSGGGSSSSGRR
jgi:hypothetical protein